MNKYEEMSRSLKEKGNNCSYSLYTAFSKDFELTANYPEPRSIDGKCGALLAALKILEDIGYSNKIKEFEEEFTKEFGYSKCVDLMRHQRRCNDYVGWSANKISELINCKL